jgi:formylglycine-generating enzyme required for sulfatase activity
MPDLIDTGGGTSVDGGVNTGGGDFIGRDQNIILSLGDLNDEEQNTLFSLLEKSLVARRVELRPDSARAQLTVSAPGTPSVSLSEDAASALLGETGRRGDVRAYLSALLVNPRYGRWGNQFVPLAGTLTEQQKCPGWTEIPPEFAELEVRGKGPQRQFRRLKLNDITDALARYPALVLLGEPGSGKTNTLERLLHDAARSALQGESDRVPLLLPLADYRDYPSPQPFLDARWRKQVGSDDLAERLHNGQLLMLCDALNEMPFRDQRDYRARVGAWRQFVGDLPDGNCVVFTCRSLDYSVPLGLPQVEIARLDDPRVADFLHRYLEPIDPALAAGAWRRLEGSELLDLVRNPWYLRMLAWLLAEGEGWPERRAGLFSRFVSALLIREEHRNHADWPGEEALEKALAALAEGMQPLGEGTRVPRSEALKQLPETIECEDGPVVTPPAVILKLGLAATLLDTTEPGEGGAEIKFYHHQLQEYFAARALLLRFEKGDDLSRRWYALRRAVELPDPGPLRNDEPLPPPPTTGWEEPTVLAAGLAADARAFLEAVCRVNPVLAARCLRESGLAHAARQKFVVQQELLGMLTESKIHLRARLAAGEALGGLGDPRFQAIEVEGTQLLLPPLVAIPAGSFRMGSRWWETRFGGRFADERPRRALWLPAFWIGRYPVTRAEYACFVADHGYRDERWWQTERARAWLRGELDNEALEAWVQQWRSIKANPSLMQQWGWSERRIRAWDTFFLDLEEGEIRAWASKVIGERSMDWPAYWDDERFNNPSQPVVGVNWFEANAYCRWLTERWHAAGEDCPAPLPAGGTLRLATEAEWERVARYPSAERYPWGRDRDGERANTEEGHVLRSSPVGVYPSGATKAGVHDLAGNVWEWTLSLYQDYPIRPGDGRDDPESPGPRVLRGGSWWQRSEVRALRFPRRGSSR